MAELEVLSVHLKEEIKKKKEDIGNAPGDSTEVVSHDVRKKSGRKMRLNSKKFTEIFFSAR